MAEGRVCSIAIYSNPGIRGGELLMREGVGIPIRELLGRIDAGDGLEFVAEDFNVEPDALSLLVALREQLQEATQQQLDQLLKAVKDHYAEKAHGPTANMEFADNALHAVAEEIERDR